MRLLFSLLMVVFCFACQSNTQQEATNSTEPTVSIEPEETITTTEYCFLSLFGEDPTYRDSTIVKLTIDGINVVGIYNWIPAGKDSARGTLTGTISGDIITVLYDYMIEGSNQQEEMIFKLATDKLLVKKGELHEVNGVLKIKDPDTAKFTEEIAMVNCE